MLFKSSIAALLLHATGAFATWSAYQEYLSTLPKHTSKHQGTRPKITYSPQKPYEPLPVSPSRGRNCYVQSHNDFKTDDSAYILDAINKCNNGGHVIFPQGTTYVIGTALDLSHLSHIDIGE
jgi:galacturan 1,4-alpha-galacturonidase